MDDHDRVSSQVNATFSLFEIMRRLQDKQGVFTYDDLADGLVNEFGMSRETADAHVTRIIVRLSSLMEQEGLKMRLVRSPPPTMQETIDGFRTMISRIVKPKAS